MIAADELDAPARPSGHLLRNGLLVLISVILAGAAAFGAIRYLDASCSPFNRQPCTRILFVGTSYTYVNDLPTVFRHLARAAVENIETAMIASGGETLAQHVSSADAQATIDGSKWQFIVLQEQSETPSIESFRESEFYPAVRSLVASVRTAGATPILLETWAHQTGWSDYSLDYGSIPRSACGRPMPAIRRRPARTWLRACCSRGCSAGARSETRTRKAFRRTSSGSFSRQPSCSSRRRRRRAGQAPE